MKTELRLGVGALLMAGMITPGCDCGGGDVTVSQTDKKTSSSGASEYSSSKLLVEWPTPGSPIDHVAIEATDAISSAVTSFTAEASETSKTLTGLKSSTTYTVTVKSCTDSSCSSSTSLGSATGTTAAELWELQGTGGDFTSLNSIVSDGNARLSLLWFGNDSNAGAMAGKINLYYGPTGGPSVSGLAVGTLDGTATDGDITSVSSFTSHAGSSGLIQVSGDAQVAEVNAGQGVPLGAALGSKVRLFFEAIGSDSLSRIYSIDSQDGYTGLDFHGSSGKTVCDTGTDYSNPSYCALTRVIGTETDDSTNYENIENARQMKLGWPMLTDWRWNGESGNFMVFTADVPSTCSSSSMTQAYALYDGVSSWEVQYGTSSGSRCPQVFEDAQAPSPMHLGDGATNSITGMSPRPPGRPRQALFPSWVPRR
jgi:hypothetical protein